jgi:hypothetical protein
VPSCWRISRCALQVWARGDCQKCNQSSSILHDGLAIPTTRNIPRRHRGKAVCKISFLKILQATHLDSTTRDCQYHTTTTIYLEVSPGSTCQRLHCATAHQSLSLIRLPASSMLTTHNLLCRPKTHAVNHSFKATFTSSFRSHNAQWPALTDRLVKLVTLRSMPMDISGFNTLSRTASINNVGMSTVLWVNLLCDQ